VIVPGGTSEKLPLHLLSTSSSIIPSPRSRSRTEGNSTLSIGVPESSDGLLLPPSIAKLRVPMTPTLKKAPSIQSEIATKPRHRRSDSADILALWTPQAEKIPVNGLSTETISETE
jgi:hypothetical protein